MTTATSRPSPSVRLLDTRLPKNRAHRVAILDAAARLDLAHGGDGSGPLLVAWACVLATGELPDVPVPTPEIVRVLVLLFPAIGSETRLHAPLRLLRQEYPSC